MALEERILSFVIVSPKGVAIHGLGVVGKHWVAASLRSSQ